MKPENSIPRISGKALGPIIQRNVVNFLDPTARKNQFARTQHCTPKLKKISVFVGTICKALIRIGNRYRGPEGQCDKQHLKRRKRKIPGKVFFSVPRFDAI